MKLFLIKIRLFMKKERRRKTSQVTVGIGLFCNFGYQNRKKMQPLINKEDYFVQNRLPVVWVTIFDFYISRILCNGI